LSSISLSLSAIYYHISTGNSNFENHLDFHDTAISIDDLKIDSVEKKLSKGLLIRIFILSISLFWRHEFPVFQLSLYGAEEIEAAWFEIGTVWRLGNAVKSIITG
jgi:hypothetical protein